MTDALLAKSRLGDQLVTLPAHARAVRDAAVGLFGEADAPSRLGREWFRFFRLSMDRFPAFVLNLGLAAVFHDLGKANDGFQREVRGAKGAQAIRHEHLSALLLFVPVLRAWVSSHANVDFPVIVSAVVSHHLKVKDGRASQRGHEFASRMLDVTGFRVFVESEDFRDVLAIAAELLGRPAPPLPEAYARWRFDDGEPAVQGEAERFLGEFAQFNRSVRRDRARQRLLLAVRAGLIAADAAGSALVRTGTDLRKWLGEAFGEPLTAQDIEEKVVTPRVVQIRRSRGEFSWHPFQVEAGQLGSRAIVLAGCGAGKTLAAWRWIQGQLGHRPAARAIFLYPTRATATEGFRDYVSWAGPEDAALIHGASAFTLEGLFTNPEDTRDPRRGQDYRVDPRLFALGYWPRRVVSATVDRFLAFMSHSYGSLCLLPMLADSVLVVDEIHSFDQAMFKALVRFVEFFDVPVLCMTASLTRERLAALQEVGFQRFPSDPDVFEDLQQQMQHPRYRVRQATALDAEQVVFETLRNGGKALWVSNTVSRCQEIASRMKARVPAGVSALCYHSRFRLTDRNTRHEDVIAGFRRQGPLLLLSTQVCEMSLDLDADVLVSEVAPVPALIQRMGRCCREPMPREGRLGRVLLCPVDSPRPYERTEIAQGEAFIEWAAGRVLSQAELARYLDEMVADPVVVDGYTSFLGSGWWAWSQEQDFREADDYTLDAILDADLPRVLEARRQGRPIDGWVLPVPRRLTVHDERLGFLGIAPASHYDAELGFLDVEVPNGRRGA